MFTLPNDALNDQDHCPRTTLQLLLVLILIFPEKDCTMVQEPDYLSTKISLSPEGWPLGDEFFGDGYP